MLRRTKQKAYGYFPTLSVVASLSSFTTFSLLLPTGVNFLSALDTARGSSMETAFRLLGGEAEPCRAPAEPPLRFALPVVAVFEAWATGAGIPSATAKSTLLTSSKHT